MPGRTTDLCQPGDRSQLEAEAPVARGFPSVPRERSKRASKPATAFSFGTGERAGARSEMPPEPLWKMLA